MLLMELLGFFAQKGFERGECLAAQAQRVAAVTRGQFAQLETHGSVFALEGFAGRLELDPDRAIPCEGGGKLAAIACGCNSKIGRASCRERGKISVVAVSLKKK